MNNLDRAVNNDLLVVSKSLLPYLNMDRQKPLAIFIKVMELIYTVNLFSNEATVRSMSRSQDTGWENDFLNDVKNNLSADKAYFIDVIMKLNEAKTLLSRQEPADHPSSYYSASDYNMHPDDSGIPENAPFPDTMQSTQTTSKKSSFNNRPSQKQANTSPNPEQLISSLSSMLDPNQAQLLKMLTSLLMPQQPSQQ